MTPATHVAEMIPLSRVKAQLLRSYARGEIDLAEVDRQIRLVAPEDRIPRWIHVAAAALAACLAAILMPASNRRN